MSNPKGKLDVLCDGVGIRIVPVHRRRGPSQTHARGMLKEIRQQHGDAHLVMVLRCLKETGENRHALWSETIGALSDVLVQRPDWLERPSDLFAVLDTIDLNDARQRALERRPWPVRQTLRARLYEVLERLMD